jgi:hypothetical protein
MTRMKQIINLVEDIFELLDMVGSTKVTQGVLTLYDIPTELRNRMSRDEQLIVLRLMKRRQKRNKERKNNEILRSHKSNAGCNR